MTQRNYHVQCECGTTIPVSTGQAGTTVSCECGRSISVPRLADLRRMAGKDPYATNAVQAIRKAFNTGELPGSDCVCCRGPVRETVRCRVVCERSRRVKGRELPEVGEKPQQGLVSLLSALVLPIQIERRYFSVETLGRDTEIDLVLAICHACQVNAGNLRRKRKLKRYLKLIPHYARLFKEYPRSTLHDISVEES